MEQSGLPPKHLYREINRLLKMHQVDRLIGIGHEIADSQLAYDLPTTFYASTEDFLQHIPDFQKEIVLIKGARHFHLEKIASALQRKVHGTHLEINLEALTHNLQFFRSKLKKSTKVMVMIKAMGYGSGSKEIAQNLQYHQADYLGVAYVDEAIELRKSGIHLPILVMNPTVESLPLFEKYQLSPEIYSSFMLAAFQDIFQQSDNSPPIHLKIDTGMNRLGFRPEEIPALLTKIKTGNTHIAGIFTHLAAADDPSFDAFTLAQLNEFREISDHIVSSIGCNPLLHALNTPGILRFHAYQFDMVRLGIGLYGYGDFGLKESSLRPISTLKTSISQIRKVKSGESVGYGRSWVAEKNSEIATVAIGYADGYRRAFGQGVGKVSIRGKHVPTVGNVCMDMCMVDVTGLHCGVGDEVIVFGDSPTLVELAAWAGTIPYEIMTNVSDRVIRVYTTE